MRCCTKSTKSLVAQISYGLGCTGIKIKSAALIADITAQALRYYLLNQQPNSLHGHYNLAAKGECSWFDYAEFIFATAKKEFGIELLIKQLNPIPTSEYPTPAKRPLNSRLNTKKLQTQFQLHLPHWQQGVAQVLGELLL